MKEIEITSLKDLTQLRTAPDLDQKEASLLMRELNQYIHNAEWFTIGIMAPSTTLAIVALREMEDLYSWPNVKIVDKPNNEGPIFLKSNQKSGEANIRIEYGLGEGILLSCQYNDTSTPSETFGPFPLDFFKPKDV